MLKNCSISCMVTAVSFPSFCMAYILVCWCGLWCAYALITLWCGLSGVAYALIINKHFEISKRGRYPIWWIRKHQIKSILLISCGHFFLLLCREPLSKNFISNWRHIVKNLRYDSRNLKRKFLLCINSEPSKMAARSMKSDDENVSRLENNSRYVKAINISKHYT